MLGDQIKYLRHLHKISQVKLAEADRQQLGKQQYYAFCRITKKIIYLFFLLN